MSNESTTGNEKQEKKKRKITETREKNDNVRSSLMHYNQLKAYSSSSDGAQDFDRRLVSKIKRYSNDSSNTFAITSTNWTQCL